jgi:2,6-dihydroxypseudooxynicotine hydrolase
MSHELPFINANRMVADGIPYPDYTAAMASVEAGGTTWFDWWDARASEYEEAGERALDDGHERSAGEWLWLASMSAHYGQYMWFHEPERREAGQRRKTDLYDRAAPYVYPAGERVELPFDGVTIPGFLRLPDGGGDGRVPVVMLIGGLESTKEESFLFENLCLERGLATFAFDGPGQGEMFFERKLMPDFERYTSAVVDALERRPELDPDRIAVLGRSLGGYYAVRSAACEPRIKACVAWGVCFGMFEFDRLPEHTREALMYVSGYTDDPDAGRRYVEEALDLSDVIGNDMCPVYAQHGARDRLFSMAHVEALERGLTNTSLVVDVEEEGDHCCHNMPTLTRPRMADWLADRLTR